MKSRLNLNMIRKVGQLVLLVPIVWGASSGIAQAATITIAPIVNSSFEDGNLTGWSVGGNGNVVAADGPAASDGTWVASFNRGNTEPGATLSQTFSTIVGATYTLTFDFRKAGSASGTAALDVVVDGSTLDTVTSNTGSSTFNSFSYSFTPTNTSTTLAFVDATSGLATNFDPILDNIQASTTTPVPEPATILGSLLAGSIGIVARRKRR